MHEADQEPRDQPPRPASIFTGLNWTVVLHLFQIPLNAFVVNEGRAFFFIGVSQLVYMIPAIVWVAFKRKEWEVAKGLAVGAAVTFLLNATCFGIVFVMFEGLF
jgi:hypothetical protein